MDKYNLPYDRDKFKTMQTCDEIILKNSEKIKKVKRRILFLDICALLIFAVVEILLIVEF